MRHPWDERWTLRAASRDDVDGVVRMFNARSQRLYGANQATRDVILGWWNSPRFDLGRDTRIVLDEDDRIIAWVHVRNPGEPYVSIGCGVTLHPELERMAELWDRLYEWGLHRARDFIPLAPPGARVSVRESANAEDEPRRDAVGRAGFELVRIENTMRMDLAEPSPPPAWPGGILVRTAEIATDLPQIAAASEEAFRDHWGHVEQPSDQVLEDWRQSVDERGSRFDPTLWFLACDGSEIVGMALCRDRVADDTSRAYVESLSVRPAWRKRGIALALLHHAFDELRRRAFEGVDLEMDSENLTGALRLYTKAGMRVIRRTYAYEKELRPGVDLTTREVRG